MKTILTVMSFIATTAVASGIYTRYPDIAFELRTACTEDRNFECDIASTLYTAKQSDWTEFVNNPSVTKLDSIPALKAALAACALEGFAYTQLTSLQKEAAATALIKELDFVKTNLGVEFEIYREDIGQHKPLEFGTATELHPSCGIAGAKCAVWFHQKGADTYLSMRGDVCD